jgi:hypothetical protein
MAVAFDRVLKDLREVALRVGLPRSTNPFGAEFLPVGFFWCMLLRTSLGHVFFAFERRELHNMTLPVATFSHVGQSRSLEGRG